MDMSPIAKKNIINPRQVILCSLCNNEMVMLKLSFVNFIKIILVYHVFNISFEII